MEAPLASKLSQLFVINAENLRQRFLTQVLRPLNQHGFLDEKTETTNNRFLIECRVCDYIGNDLA